MKKSGCHAQFAAGGGAFSKGPGLDRNVETKAATAGFSTYLSSLVATVLFPLQWMRMMRVARAHESVDANGVKKVAAGAVLGLLLAAGGAFMVVDFEAGATAGIYDTLDGRLSANLGNDQYLEHVAAAASAQDSVELAEDKLAAGEDPAIWEPNRQNAIDTRNEEQAKADALEPNHILFNAVSEFVMAQDDVGAKATIANRGAIDYPGMDERSANSFAIKDGAMADMTNFLNWFVWPGIAGLLFAPLVFAMGTILKNAHVPSDSVGWKQYPAGAMALFLLLGGFGVPALFFAAWTFQDIGQRSRVGQIAL